MIIWVATARNELSASDHPHNRSDITKCCGKMFSNIFLFLYDKDKQGGAPIEKTTDRPSNVVSHGIISILKA